MRGTRLLGLAGAVALTLSSAGVALAGPGDHDHGGEEPAYEYEDVDCPGGELVWGQGVNVALEQREDHYNGRTECVIANGTPMGMPEDHSIVYNPYQPDQTPGNSKHDRGPALRYHNGETPGETGHGHGNYGCWNRTDGTAGQYDGTPESQAAEEARIRNELQAELYDAFSKWHGMPVGGMAAMMADLWWPFPVAAAKSFHMQRTDGPDVRVKSQWVESFMTAETDDGFEAINGMFTLGNEGAVKNVYADPEQTIVAAEYDSDGDNYVDADIPGIDFKRVNEEHLPLWESATTAGDVCDLPWHPHVEGEGAATSFDPENPTTSAWMSHVGLYMQDGDPFGYVEGGDGAEPHAWWTPLHYVPALCNPQGPCL